MLDSLNGQGRRTRRYPPASTAPEASSGNGSTSAKPEGDLFASSSYASIGDDATFLLMMASDMPTFGTDSAAKVTKDGTQRLDPESLFFSLLLRFTSCGGDLRSSRLDNVVR